MTIPLNTLHQRIYTLLQHCKLTFLRWTGYGSPTLSTAAQPLPPTPTNPPQAATPSPLPPETLANDLKSCLRISAHAADPLEDRYQRLQQIIRVTGLGTWEWHITTGETVFNERCAEMLGYTLTELTPSGTVETWRQLTHAEDLKIADAAVRQHWREATPSYACEIRMRSKEGSWIWIEARGQVVSRSADGQPLWMVGTHRDITQRKHTEIALRQSQALYRQLVEEQPSLICWFLPDTTLTFVNAAYARFFATSPAELLGQKFIDFLNPEDRVTVQQYLATFTPTLPAQQSEHATRRADGVERWHLWDDFAFFDEQGQIVSFQSFGTDITERKHAEVALQHKEIQLRNVLYSVVEAIIIIDANCTITSLNPATERIFGYHATELIGRNVALIMPQGVGQQHNNFVQQYLAGGEAKIIGIGREVQGRRRDGSLFAAELAISDFTIEEQTFFTGIIRDISERKHYEAELIRARETAEAANEAKSAFLAAMSHEIRTPMNGVIGLIDLLKLSRLNADQQAMVATIKDSAFTLLSIIDEILDFSKIEANKLTLEYTPVSLKQIVEGVGDTLQPLAQRKQLRLDYSCDPALPEWVLADSVRLRQILFNLTGNAVKFTSSEPPQTGLVRVQALCTQSDDQHCEVHFQVKDTGIGIAPEMLSKLFQPFTQAEDSTTRRFGGTGLGLSICARLIEMMGGRIHVESHPGQGSTFHVYLRFERSSAPPDQATVDTEQLTVRSPAPSIQEARAKGQLILVAEDNPTNQTVLGYQLKALGYVAEMTNDGLEALERLRQGSYALLLTDYQMPNLDGLALTAAIREMERYTPRRLPIIVLTANAVKGEAERFLEAGADDVLNKPILLDNFRQLLARWMPTVSDTASPLAASNDQAAVDPSVLKHIIGDDPSAIHALLVEFLQAAAVNIQQIQTAYAAHDAKTLSQYAHRLKSSAQSVGAHRLGEICQALEDEGKTNPVSALETRFAELNREWAKVADFIQNYINKGE